MMHTHLQQDESITVVQGTIGYQVEGEEPKYAGPGESVYFERGQAHRFWNAGSDMLIGTGWVKPVHSFPFFLSSIYAAQNKTGSARPEPFDAAYLMTRYRTEYKLHGMPGFVRKVVIPATYALGRLLGKYRKFKGAPKPLPPVRR